jgi:hypothetical protein
MAKVRTDTLLWKLRSTCGISGFNASDFEDTHIFGRGIMYFSTYGPMIQRKVLLHLTLPCLKMDIAGLSKMCAVPIYKIIWCHTTGVSNLDGKEPYNVACTTLQDIHCHGSDGTVADVTCFEVKINIC